MPQQRFNGRIVTPRVIDKGYCNYTSDTVIGAISSQDFGSGFEQYSDMGAADCKIGRRAVTIHQIIAPGVYFNGSGPAQSENVITYRNAGGLPGAVKNSQTVKGVDSGGSFTIPLTPFKVKGTVWFTVQVRMDFASGGEWGWDVSAVAHGKYGDVWQDPGGGFGNCQTWCPIGTVYSGAVSFLYAIS